MQGYPKRRKSDAKTPRPIEEIVSAITEGRSYAYFSGMTPAENRAIQRVLQTTSDDPFEEDIFLDYTDENRALCGAVLGEGATLEVVIMGAGPRLCIDSKKLCAYLIQRLKASERIGAENRQPVPDEEEV